MTSIPKIRRREGAWLPRLDTTHVPLTLAIVATRTKLSATTREDVPASRKLARNVFETPAESPRPSAAAIWRSAAEPTPASANMR
jgi:hypothetical protein